MQFMSAFSRRYAPPWVWLASLLTATLLFLSLDLAQERPVYQLKVAPAAGYSGSLKVVFYGLRIDALRKEDAISVPASGWTEIRALDSVTFSADADAPPLVIRTADEPILFALLRYPQPSAAVLSDGAGYKDQIELQSATESILPIEVGGANSVVPSNATQALYSLPARVGIFALIFLATSAIALRLMTVSGAGPASTPKRRETLWLAFPLALSTAATQLSYYPANVGYDAALQWVQAAIGGELSEPLGYAATYLMRLFARIDTSPALLVAVQGILAALAVGLILRELRFRGVPAWSAAAAALVLAFTPQYPLFFTNLGKDAISAVAVLFFSWALMAAFRTPRGARVPAFLLTSIVCSALAAGLMRGNVMPAIMVAMLCVLILLYRRHAKRDAIVTGVVFLALAIAIPNALSILAKAERREFLAEHAVEDVSERPPRLFANLYIYHLFAASVASGVPIDPEDSALFYQLAPREAWADFNCLMTDTTQTSVSRNILLDRNAYLTFLWNHQLDLAKAVGRILWAHPKILLDRQLCVTRMIWHIGVGQLPFQTTAALGIDDQERGFLPLAGPHRSLIPALTETIEQYKYQTETASWFWLFWKPALPLCAGLFIVLMFAARTRDAGVLMAAVAPVASVLLLLVVIPFPAYRYAYPAVLMMMLLSTLAFARPRDTAAGA